MVRKSRKTRGSCGYNVLTLRLLLRKSSRDAWALFEEEFASHER
jgi:hypothetical protein